jgi:hypothetical protein
MGYQQANHYGTGLMKSIISIRKSTNQSKYNMNSPLP